MHRKKYIALFNLPVIWLFVILFFATGFSAFSQKSDIDSVKTKKPVAEHSPRRATIYSAVLPGLGQIYNRKYWKVPIVYGGFVTLGYFINFNNERYTTYKQAYFDIIDNDPNSTSYLNLNVSAWLKEPKNIKDYTEALRGTKDSWRRNRDLVVIGTAVFYALNIIDASVDAHFFNFDISEDLAINWIPGPVICMDRKMIGLHCRFTF